VESLRGKLKFRDRDYQAQQQELNDKDREFKRLKKDLESQIAAADKKRRKVGWIVTPC
jgi:phage-related tail protein